MSSYGSASWLPYLGDAIAVRAGDRDLAGAVTRYDASVVEVHAPGIVLALGQSVGAAWRVGTDVHRATGRICDLSDDGFTFRLPPAPVQASRREHERTPLSLPLQVTADSHGSYGAATCRARSLDLSDGGMRALIDAETAFEVGELLRVQVELGGLTEVLLASVVWETGHGAGERLAGLRFQSAVEATAWAALSRVDA